MRTYKLLIFSVLLSMGSIAAQSYTWKSVNLQGMGYVTGLIAHPTSGQIYARTDTYGIYRWDRTTEKWSPMMDGKVKAASIESFAIDPSNENVVYTVNGNNDYALLYKSTDKGETWTELTNFNSKLIMAIGNGPWRGGGERLIVDPNNGGKVLFFGSRNKGLWKSTDQGVSWSQIPATTLPFGSNAGIIFVTIDKTSGNASTNSQIVYAGVHGQGIFKSTDGGSTWNLLPGGPATTLFPVRSSIANNGTIYFTFSSTDNNGASAAVYKYSGTGNMVDVTPTNKVNEGFWGIAVDPSNANNVATFQWQPQSGNGIHYSTDGGTNWTAKGFGSTSRYEPSWYPSWAGWTYAAAMIMDPLNAKTVWLSTGFAAYNTPDISASSPIWTAKMNNFEELVVNLVSCPPAVGSNVADLIAGFADKQGLRIRYRNTVPTVTVEPEKFGIMTGIDYCVADPLFIVTVGGNQSGDANYESDEAKYRFSQNNGRTWTAFTPPTATSTNGNIAISATDKLHWVIAPKNRKGLFNQPYFTTDKGAHWTLSTGLPTNIENGCTEQWSASQFLISDKVNGQTFYYYTEQTESGKVSGFYRSTDGGASFTKMSAALPSSYKSIIAAVPSKEGHLYYCNKAGNGLYFSADGGANWQTKPNVTNCKAVGFGKAIATSLEPTIFIFATINGKSSVYQSTDAGTTWTDINDGSIPLNISAITGDMRTAGLVYIATSGRGILYGEATAPNALHSLTTNSLKVFPNPVTDILNIELAQNESDSSLSLYNLTGEQLYVQKMISPENKTTIDLKALQLKKGIYILKNKSENEEFVAKIVKQ